MTQCGACGSVLPSGRDTCPACGVGATQAGELSAELSARVPVAPPTTAGAGGQVLADPATDPATDPAVDPAAHPAVDPATDAGSDTGAGIGLGIEYASFRHGHSPGSAIDAAVEQAGADRPHRRGTRLPGLVLVAVGTVLIMIAGYTTYRGAHGHRPGVPPGADPASTGAASTGPTGAAGSTGPATPSDRPSTTPSIGGTPTAGADSQTVTVAPALRGEPDVADVSHTLTTYFTAINGRDFDAYRSVLVGVDQRVRDEQEFRDNFRSTTDSDVWLVGIRRDSGGEVFATVTFRSRQDPVDSPDLTSDCLSWVVTYPMTRVDGDLKIDVVRTFAVTHRPC